LRGGGLDGAPDERAGSANTKKHWNAIASDPKARLNES
jgi:hypothetical protein